MADYNESRNRSRIDYPNDGAIHTRRVTADEVAHRDAYVRGANVQQTRQHDQEIRSINRRIDQERRINQERLDRDRSKTAIGLLLGILLTSALGLLAAIFYFASRKDEARIVPIPAPVVQPETSNQSTSDQPDSDQPQSTQRTTIIERLREIPVEQPATEAEQPQQIVVPVPVPTNAPNNNSTDTPTDEQTSTPTTESAPTQSTTVAPNQTVTPNQQTPNQQTVTPNQPVQQPAPQGSNGQIQNGAQTTTPAQ